MNRQELDADDMSLKVLESQLKHEEEQGERKNLAAIESIQEEIKALQQHLADEIKGLPKSNLLKHAQITIDQTRTTSETHQEQHHSGLRTRRQKNTVYQRLLSMVTSIEKSFAPFEDKTTQNAEGEKLVAYRKKLIEQMKQYASFMVQIRSTVSQVQVSVSGTPGVLIPDVKISTESMEFIGLRTLLLSRLNHGFMVSKKDTGIIDTYVFLLEEKSNQLLTSCQWLGSRKDPDLKKLMEDIGLLYQRCWANLQLAAEVYDSLTLQKPLCDAKLSDILKEKAPGLPRDEELHIPTSLLRHHQGTLRVLEEKRLELGDKVARIFTVSPEVTTALEELKLNALQPYIDRLSRKSSDITTEYSELSTSEIKKLEIRVGKFTGSFPQLLNQLSRFLQSIKQEHLHNFAIGKDVPLVNTSWQVIFESLYEFTGKPMPESVATLTETLEGKSTKKTFLKTTKLENTNFTNLKAQKELQGAIELKGFKKGTDDSKEKVLSAAHGSIDIGTVIEILKTFKLCVSKEKDTLGKNTLLFTATKDSKLLQNIETHLDRVINVLKTKQVAASNFSKTIDEQILEVQKIIAKHCHSEEHKTNRSNTMTAFNEIQSTLDSIDETKSVETPDSSAALPSSEEVADPVNEALKLDVSYEETVQLGLEQMSKNHHFLIMVEKIVVINPKHPCRAQMKSFSDAIVSYSTAVKEVKKESGTDAQSLLALRHGLIETFKKQIHKDDGGDLQETYRQDMLGRLQPLRQTLSGLQSLQGFARLNLPGKIVLNILEQLKKGWINEAKQKDQYFDSFREIKFPPAEVVFLLISEFKPSKNYQYKFAVILTNKNEAFFINRSKLVQKRGKPVIVQQVNRQGIPACKESKLTLQLPSEKVSKIIEESMSIAGFITPTMETILSILDAAVERLITPVTLTKKQGGTVAIPAEQRVTGEIDIFRNKYREAKLPEYKTFLEEQLVPLEKTLVALRKNPAGFEPVGLIQDLASVETKMTKFLVNEFKTFAKAHGRTHATFEYYFNGPLEESEREMKLLATLLPGACTPNDITRFVSALGVCWSGFEPGFQQATIYTDLCREIDTLKGDVFELRPAKIEIIRLFLKEVSKFYSYFEALRKELTSVRTSIYEMDLNATIGNIMNKLVVKLNRFFRDSRTIPAYQKLEEEFKIANDMKEKKQQETKKYTALITFFDEIDFWAPVFCQKPLAKIGEQAHLASLSDSKDEILIPKLMRSLLRALEKFNPKILQGTLWQSLQQQVNANEKDMSKIKENAKKIDEFINAFDHIAENRVNDRNEKNLAAIEKLQDLALGIGVGTIPDETRLVNDLVDRIESSDQKEEDGALVHLFRLLNKDEDLELENELPRFLASTQGVQQWVIPLLQLSHQGGDVSFRGELYQFFVSEKFKNLSLTRKHHCLKEKFSYQIRILIDIRLKNLKDLNDFLHPNGVMERTESSAQALENLMPSLVKVHERVSLFRGQVEEFTLMQTESNTEMHFKSLEKRSFNTDTGVMVHDSFETGVNEFVTNVRSKFPEVGSLDEKYPVPVVTVKESVDDGKSMSLCTAIQKKYPDILEKSPGPFDKLGSFFDSHSGSSSSSSFSSSSSSSSSASDSLNHLSSSTVIKVMSVEEIEQKLQAINQFSPEISADLAVLVKVSSLRKFMEFWFSNNLNDKLVTSSRPFPAKREAWGPLVVKEFSKLRSLSRAQQAMLIIAKSTVQIQSHKGERILALQLSTSNTLYQAVAMANNASPLPEDQKAEMSEDSLLRYQKGEDTDAKILQKIAQVSKVRIFIYKEDQENGLSSHSDSYPKSGEEQPLYLSLNSAGEYRPLIPTSWIRSETHAFKILGITTRSVRHDKVKKTERVQPLQDEKKSDLVGSPVPTTSQTPVKTEAEEIAESDAKKIDKLLPELKATATSLYEKKQDSNFAEDLKNLLTPLKTWKISQFVKLWVDSRMDETILPQQQSLRTICSTFLDGLYTGNQHELSKLLVDASLHELSGEKYFQLEDDCFDQIEQKAQGIERAIFVLLKTHPPFAREYKSLSTFSDKMTESGGSVLSSICSLLLVNIHVYGLDLGNEVVCKQKLPVKQIQGTAAITFYLFKSDKGYYFPMISAKWCIGNEAQFPQLLEAVNSLKILPPQLSGSVSSTSTSSVTPVKPSVLTSSSSSSSSSSTSVSSPAPVGGGGWSLLSSLFSSPSTSPQKSSGQTASNVEPASSSSMSGSMTSSVLSTVRKTPKPLPNPPIRTSSNNGTPVSELMASLSSPVVGKPTPKRQTTPNSSNNSSSSSSSSSSI